MEAGHTVHPEQITIDFIMLRELRFLGIMQENDFGVEDQLQSMNSGTDAKDGWA